MSRRRKETNPPKVAEGGPDQSAMRRQLHKETYDELVKKQISNAENFDKAILTLSSSGLGLSLAFIKDFVPIATASAKPALMLSWLLFTVAVISTVGSYITSQQAIAAQIKASEDYYIGEDAEALNRANPSAAATLRLNVLAGIAFISAITLTMLFVTFNLSKQ